MLKDRYLLEPQRQGMGGFSDIYLAEDREHRVIVKALKYRARDSDIADRFFSREIRALQRIRDARIVRLLDAWEDKNGERFLVFERILGQSLNEVLKAQPQRWLSFADAAKLFRDLGGGLAAVHDADVYHRDIKPENIMIECPDETPEFDRVKIIDFGIARIGDHSTYAGGTTGITGTLDYMAPELLDNRKPTDAAGWRRLDIYSLGVIAYEALTGVHPFPSSVAEGLVGIFQLRREYKRPNFYRWGKIPAAACELIERALEMEPQKRPDNALAFGCALANALLGVVAEGVVSGVAPTERAPEEVGAASPAGPEVPEAEAASEKAPDAQPPAPKIPTTPAPGSDEPSPSPVGATKGLWPPRESAPSTPAASGMNPSMFDEQGHLRIDRFAFPFSPHVYLRAVRRMDNLGRSRLSAEDLVAGLLRQGDLTRGTVRALGLDPDRAYEAMTPRKRMSFKVTAKLWHRSMMEPQVVELFERARRDALAAPGRSDRRLYELDLLHQLVSGGLWESLSVSGIPTAKDMRIVLDLRRQREQLPWVTVPLDDLDDGARGVVEYAHLLGQQVGQNPIGQRVFLAALLTDDRGLGAEVMRRIKVDHDLLRAFLLQSASGETLAPASFGLSADACHRVVTPVLIEARRRAAGGRVTFAHLFDGFLAILDPAMRDSLRSCPLAIDVALIWGMLRSEGCEDEKVLAPLDESAANVVRRAQILAQDRGGKVVDTAVLLAAFLRQPRGVALRTLGDDKRVELADKVLASASADAPTRASSDAAEMVSVIVRRARGILPGDTPISEGLLFRAFVEEVPDELHERLRRYGHDLKAAAQAAAAN
jgi:tRNA A-37 threonylcarbamoyl transferase component Bud32